MHISLHAFKAQHVIFNTQYESIIRAHQVATIDFAPTAQAAVERFNASITQAKGALTHAREMAKMNVILVTPEDHTECLRILTDLNSQVANLVHIARTKKLSSTMRPLELSDLFLDKATGPLPSNVIELLRESGLLPEGGAG